MRYFESTRPHADKGSYLLTKQNSVLDILPVLKLFYKLRSHYREPVTLYTGNLKTLYARCFLLPARKFELKTFDDGAGNVRKAGYFYTNDSSKFRMILKSVQADWLEYFTLRDSVKKHYSIFELPNAFPNTDYIEVFSTSSSEPATAASGSTINVLLTAPFHEANLMSRSQEESFYQSIIQKFKITHFIKHPLEKNINKFPLANLEEVEDELIAEDIILNLAKNAQVNVFGCSSTVLLNLKQSQQISLHHVHCDVLPEDAALEEIFREAGITILHL